MRLGQPSEATLGMCLIIAEEREDGFGRLAPDHTHAIEFEQRESIQPLGQFAADDDRHRVQLG